MAFETALKIGVDTRGAEVNLRRTGVALDRLGNRAGRMVKGMGGAFDKLRRNLFSMRGLIASLGVGLAFRAITQATI